MSQVRMAGACARRRLSLLLVGYRSLRFLACRLVDEDGDAFTNHLRVREPQVLLVARVAEEALAGPEDDREDH